jgi:diguanylate cyclase (GGDEF)-like protein/PAS domain S-box-containing protein
VRGEGVSKKVLVVEDERIIAEEIARSLKDLGYAVTALATTGEEAIKLALASPPDVVLMDVMLRGSVDGIKAAAHIRESLDIPVVYLTSHSDESTLKRAKETGPFGYILKPFEDRELKTTIEMAVYSHSVEKSLKESERWLSTTLRSIADGVVVADSRWDIEFMNPVAEALTGWSLKEAVGRPLTEVFKTVFEADELLARAFNEGAFTGARMDTVLIDRGGGEVPISLNAAPIKESKDAANGLVLTFYDITERKRAEEEKRKLIDELDRLSKTDSLTGILNRGAIMERLEYEMSRALRYGLKLALVHCDIDRFKDVNDTYGHASGDAVLRGLAEALKRTIRRSDMAGRYGGDEFLLVLPQSSLEEGMVLAERVRKAVSAAEFPIEGGAVKTSMSFGVAQLRKHGDSPDQLIKRADDALYASKREGRDRVSTMA